MKPENERVETLQLRGFVADNLKDAFVESYAISKATRCKQHLFSVSINPPTGTKIDDEDYLNAADRIEAELGLSAQPRAIVRHWKRGDDGVLRSHAHAVWCRINVNAMKAVHLPFTKRRLRAVSRELHKEHGLKLPAGLLSSADRDPRNFTLEQWQQCKRAKKDVHQVKDDFQDAWSISDSRAAFAHALEERGYILAQGRRGYVAVDYKGEVYAVRTYAGVNSTHIKARLGTIDGLPTLDAAKSKAALQVASRLNELRSEQQNRMRFDQHLSAVRGQRIESRYSKRTAALDQYFETKSQDLRATHPSSLRRGLFGLWDRLTGKRSREIAQLQKNWTSFLSIAHKLVGSKETGILLQQKPFTNNHVPKGSSALTP